MLTHAKLKEVDGELVIVMPKELYGDLMERADWLSWLEAAGVDNWEGFDYARELRQQQQDKDDKEFMDELAGIT